MIGRVPPPSAAASAVSQAKSSSLSCSEAIGSSACASKPAERKTASGSKALTAGSRSSVHALRKASEPQPAGSGALTI